MAFELRNMTFGLAPADGVAGHVSFFAGDGPTAEQSTLWISGRVSSEMQSMKSLALNQLAALHRARDLIDEEIARLTPLYRQAELSR